MCEKVQAMFFIKLPCRVYNDAILAMQLRTIVKLEEKEMTKKIAFF